MTELWSQRNDREKILIGVAAALLACLLLWQFLYRPVSNYPAAQERAYKQAVLDLKIMQKGQGIIQNQTNANAAPITKLTEEQFQSTITKAAKAHNLIITRRQPKGLEELTLWFDSVDGKSFYAWVDELTGGYNIALSKAQIYRNDDSSVRVLVTFELADKA
ncbi:MAG: type II secretion system protein M [Robiginitomaculum sp.]|nr:type II secretion system protein M [Robiginitomaculum sp.]